MKKHRYCKKTFSVSCVLVVLLILAAVLAPAFLPYAYNQAEPTQAFQAPGPEHLMGTDKLGRDVFSRVVYGTRYSLSSALMLVSCVFLVGTVLGILAGYFGGALDALIMRLADMMISFPGMVLAIAIAGIMGSSLLNAILALTAVSWTKYARLARSFVLKVKNRDFVTAARISGARHGYLIRRYMLPNVLPALVVTATTDIGTMIMELATLSFLGFGATAPLPEWGVMLNEGRAHIQSAPWLMVYPGLAIFITVVVFNLFGDGLRDLMDPRDHGKE